MDDSLGMTSDLPVKDPVLDIDRDFLAGKARSPDSETSEYDSTRDEDTILFGGWGIALVEETSDRDRAWDEDPAFVSFA